MFDIHRKIISQRTSTAPTDLVGWQGKDAVTQIQFAQKVAHWRLVMAQFSPNEIALYLNDSIEFAAALFGAWHAKKTVFLTADVLENNCRNLARKLSIFVGDFPANFATSLPLVNAHRVIDDKASEAGLPQLDADFPALVVYTSGSTGEAQAIPKKWSQLATEIETLELLFGAKLGSADIFSTVSHHHIYGLLFKVLWPFASGRAIIAEALNFPEQMQQHMTQRRCALIASPAHLKRLPSHLDWSGVREHLCVVFSSGGPLLPDALANVQTQWLHTPIEVYGSSETGGIAWRQRLDTNTQAWQVFPNVSWRIDPEERLLQVRSPHLPDEEWFQLADQVDVVDAQHFQLCGRRDRVVKIEEKRISLNLMENALRESGLVQEAHLLLSAGDAGAEPPPQARQHIYAFVVLTKEGRAYLQTRNKFALNQALRAVLSQHVEAIALPRRWRYLDAMPINSQGKTTQAQLLSMMEPIGEQEVAEKIITKPHWRVLEQDTERLLMEIIVPSELLYFKGHFPIAPVLPGVVQVDWAIYFARQYFNLPIKFIGMQGLKFQQIISADTPVHLELQHQVQKQSLQFRYFSDLGQHATGRVLFGPADSI